MLYYLTAVATVQHLLRLPDGFSAQRVGRGGGEVAAGARGELAHEYQVAPPTAHVEGDRGAAAGTLPVMTLPSAFSLKQQPQVTVKLLMYFAFKNPKYFERYKIEILVCVSPRHHGTFEHYWRHESLVLHEQLTDVV